MSLGLIEMIAFFGIVLAFGVYQLVSVNRSIRQEQQRDLAANARARKETA